nr:MAG TPA: hypothetical protein [Caudoviricetes sp.]
MIKNNRFISKMDISTKHQKPSKTMFFRGLFCPCIS